LPSPTRYLPPPPQASATPTPTRTLLPAPPWVRVPLQASDPRTVKLAFGKVQLVEFFAYWSGPSQAMAPLVRGLEEAYASEVNFVYLDIDDPAVATFERELRFRLEPHFFLLDAQGRVLRQWQGYVTTETLQSAIDDALLR
jgi:thiol-disulfide isomerase/thioredoxin